MDNNQDNRLPDQRKADLGPTYRRRSPVPLNVFLAFMAFVITWTLGAMTMHVGYQYGRESRPHASTHTQSEANTKGQGFKAEAREIKIPVYQFKTEEKELTVPVQRIEIHESPLTIPQQSVVVKTTPLMVPSTRIIRGAPSADHVPLPSSKPGPSTLKKKSVKATPEPDEDENGRPLPPPKNKKKGK